MLRRISLMIGECEDALYIDGVGYISREKIDEWDTILSIQANKIKDEFWGRRATKRTECEMQAAMDALYGDGIFRVYWPEGSIVIYVDLIDKPKLVKRLMDLERGRYYWERKDTQLGCFLEKKYGHYEVKK